MKERLAEHNNDAKAALKSLKTTPLYLDDEQTKLLEYGTCYKEEVVIRYPIESIKVKDVQYIIDTRVKELVKARLAEYGNKEKEAFKDLATKPIWFNETKRIPIRTVRCFTGLKAVEPVKKDEEGKDIGFVKPGNNHHIAIYIDESGNMQEHVCSFWHAVERKKCKLPVIIENPKAIWDKVLSNKEIYADSFLSKLPDDKWTIVLSLQQNQMFILGLTNDEIENALKQNDKALLSKYLYRVQKISTKDYVLRHHLETALIDDNNAALSKRFYQIRSLSALYKLNPFKVGINYLGEIISL